MLDLKHGDIEIAHFHFVDDNLSLDIDSEDHDETSHAHIQVIESLHSDIQALLGFDHLWDAKDSHSIIIRNYKPNLPPPNHLI